MLPFLFIISLVVPALPVLAETNVNSTATHVNSITFATASNMTSSPAATAPTSGSKRAEYSDATVATVPTVKVNETKLTPNVRPIGSVWYQVNYGPSINYGNSAKSPTQPAPPTEVPLPLWRRVANFIFRSLLGAYFFRSINFF